MCVYILLDLQMTVKDGNGSSFKCILRIKIKLFNIGHGNVCLLA